MARIYLVSFASMLVLAGCTGGGGPATYECKGKVTYNGAPVKEASVFFVPQEGATAAATTNEQGEYTILAIEGTNTVRISKLEVSSTTGAAGPGGALPGMGGGDALKDLNPENMSKMAEQMKKNAAAQGGNQTPPPAESKPETQKNDLPARYGTETSELRAEVTKDPTKNVFDFDLKD